MRHAFTLIELLVVITIIAVLLTLLTPALDKAIYQAELASCGVNLRTIATAANIYSGDNKRHYPVRDGLMEESSYFPYTLARDKREDRPRLRPYAAIKTFVDPLTKSIDLDYGTPGSLATDSGGAFYATYELFFGWRWRKQVGMKGMDKVGDRFEWDGLGPTGEDKVYQFRFLAGDHDYIDQGGGSAHGNHPDADGVMFDMALENQDYSSVSPLANAANGARKISVSRWQSITTSRRGPIDVQLALDDTSVQRYLSVTWDEGGKNDRVTTVDETTDGQREQDRLQLPAR